MAEHQVTFSAEERDYLINLLEMTLKQTEIEEHRTRKPSYREFVVHQEALIEQLLQKLRN